MKRFILLLGVLGACVLGLKAEPKEIPVIQVTSVWNMEHLAKVKKQIQTPFLCNFLSGIASGSRRLVEAGTAFSHDEETGSGQW